MNEVTKGSVLEILIKNIIGKWFLLNDKRLKDEKFVKITKYNWRYNMFLFSGIGIYPLRKSVSSQHFSNFQSLERLIPIEDDDKIKELNVLYEKYKAKELLNDTPHKHFEYAERID